ncbi:MAG: aminotransferase, partial [Candidatus Omnitrophica bacterium]|nr:aminotransferase [Candidatus Omnitrophota bacterium]
MIRLSKSVMGELEKEAAGRAIEDGYLGMGSFVKEFEGKLSDYLGAKKVMC